MSDLFQNAAAEAKLMIALDMPNIDAAYSFAMGLNLRHVVFKIGLELLYAGGIELVKRLTREGYAVFVDAKVLDIGHTVERAAAQVAETGAAYLTVHAHDATTMAAAVRGSAGSSLRLLGVTVLTSTSPQEVKEQGIDLPLGELVLKRAGFAKDAGFYGVITSPLELNALKGRFGEGLHYVTPGIRPASGDVIRRDDQARTSTPFEAIRAGATAIVVGRPILQAKNPQVAAAAIVAEIARAMREA